MSDVLLNFSSQWPTIQVAKVIDNPTDGTAYAHGLPYPPFSIAFGANNGTASYTPMNGLDCDETNVYTKNNIVGYPDVDCVVIYAVDITEAETYQVIPTAYGTVLDDTSGGQIDMREFLLHSRAVGPMVENITTEDWTVGVDTLSYTHTLAYPTFSFGWMKAAQTIGAWTLDRWISVPLRGQSYPTMATDGYTSTLANTTAGAGIAFKKASILTLRNPAIITSNTVDVTI